VLGKYFLKLRTYMRNIDLNEEFRRYIRYQKEKRKNREIVANKI